MDMEVLKKKISTFRGEGGQVKITDDGLLMEILMTWEQRYPHMLRLHGVARNLLLQNMTLYFQRLWIELKSRPVPLKPPL